MVFLWPSDTQEEAALCPPLCSSRRPIQRVAPRDSVPASTSLSVLPLPPTRAFFPRVSPVRESRLADVNIVLTRRDVLLGFLRVSPRGRAGSLSEFRGVIKSRNRQPEQIVPLLRGSF